MTPLFKKLNLKDHRSIFVVNARKTFDSELDLLDGVTIRRRVTSKSTVSFAVFFVQTFDAIEKAAVSLGQCDEDPIIWFAYPKASSKNLMCEFNRDNGWDAVGNAGFEGVRQVSIDDDWSALRFRRVDHIKKMKRNAKMAISKAGKARTKR